MELSARAAVIALTASGGGLARRIAAALGDAEVHGLRGRIDDADIFFTATPSHLRALFEARRPIVGVCAAGILVRALAPALDDKHAEPPVVAVSDDGAFVVPLLGGHRGGVELARRIGAAIDAPAAITTAGDRRFRVALDQPPRGWALANPEHYKPFVAALLQGARVRVPADIEWLAESALPIDDAGELAILAGDARADGSPTTLVYHPRCIAIGIGCERGAAPGEVIALARACLDEAGLAHEAVAAVFSIDLKSDEPAIHALAESLGVPARFLDAPALEAQAPRLRNPSDVVFREVGCHGVAEGAALAAVGSHGALIVEKTKSARATCAIARAGAPLAASSIGAPRGELLVAGIGPGDADALTPAARAAIESAGHIVGYRLYLDLVAALVRDQTVHPYALGEERDRVERAIALAAGGERVALVCSGDPGVYAMASLVMEMLDNAADPRWRRIAVQILPGVSALQSAAARAGAPIGHDFCAVSLSDLLTPREVIEKRLAAAADADFVIALYNPISAARRETFDRALQILRTRRTPDTPVVVARNLGRAGEQVEIIRLDGLDPARIDMMTVLLIGSSKTRTFALGGLTRAYTPRGYAVDGRRRAAPVMTVHFIGAGPGDPELITVRGRRLIETCPVVLYAGSLVPREVIAFAPESARVLDTAPMTLDEIIDEMRAAHASAKDVARVHSGDPSLYGATAEQMRRLAALGIAYDVTPGVPAYAAAAAALERELTLPGVSQTVILTRTRTRSSPMPDGEALAALGRTGATLAIHLSIRSLRAVCEELAPICGAHCPAAIVYRASWPDQRIVTGTLGDLAQKARPLRLRRTALILVGRVLADETFDDSALYDAAHHHLLRPRKKRRSSA